jgi:DNA-binding beta-propeller fold protein YncE
VGRPGATPVGRAAGWPIPESAPKLALVWSTDGGSDPLGRPIAATVDRHGDVYVADAVHGRIRVFDRDGRSIRQWGGEGVDVGQFRFAALRCADQGACATEIGGGVAVDEQDRVYVADYGNHRVQVFDRAGRFLAGWGREGAAPGEFRLPSGAAVDGRGRVHVCDSLNRRIQQFDRAGRFLAEWGSAPGGLAVDERGRVYVGYPWLSRVQIFDGQGRFLAVLAWGAPGGGGPDASALAVDRAGRIYVAGIGADVLQLDGEGRLMASWNADSWGIGRLVRPVGVAVDGDGDIYVADPGAGRVAKFRLLTPTTR